MRGAQKTTIPTRGGKFPKILALLKNINYFRKAIKVVNGFKIQQFSVD
jgi:hypothetical protein